MYGFPLSRRSRTAASTSRATAISSSTTSTRESRVSSPWARRVNRRPSMMTRRMQSSRRLSVSRLAAYPCLSALAAMRRTKSSRRSGASSVRFSGHRLGLPVLQPADSGRLAGAFRRHRRGDGSANPRLQHPLSHIGQPRECDPAAACRAAQYRRCQGQLRQHRAISRSSREQTRRILGSDRGGCAVLPAPVQRCGRRHPGVSSYCDGSLRCSCEACCGQRSSGEHEPSGHH